MKGIFNNDIRVAKFRTEWVFAMDAESIGLLDAVSKSATSARNECPPSKKVNVYVVSESEDPQDIHNSSIFFAVLGHANRSSYRQINPNSR